MRRNVKLLAAGVVLAVITWALATGTWRRLADPHALLVTLTNLGPRGYLAFVLLYAFSQPLGVPGTVFIMVAPLIWPWPIAFALSLAGTMAASVIGFAGARFIARDFFASTVPARFHKYDDALAEHGFATTFTLRFIFWMPQWLHALLGVSKVGFWTHFWASLLAYIVPLLLVSYFGQKIFDFMRQVPLWGWLALGAVLLLAGYVWLRRPSSSRE